MTEPRLADLFAGIKAHRSALVRAAGDLAESGNRLADLALRLDKIRLKFDSEECMKASSLVARVSHELASGLERIDRLVGDAKKGAGLPDDAADQDPLEDTRPMGLDEVASIKAEDG